MNLYINLGIIIVIYLRGISFYLFKGFQQSFIIFYFCPLLYLFLKQIYEEMLDFISNKENENAQDIILHLFDGDI